MGKQKEQKKKQIGSSRKQKRKCEESPRAYDKDTVAFISLSQELREEGNRLFQRRDYEVAMLMYEKAIKLLPGNHVDVPYLRSNMAACYMQMGSPEYPKAVYECNLALEVNPNYTKALLKRARCYEALSRLDLALRDARRVMEMEKNNFMAAEIAERVKATIDQNGGATDIPVNLIPVPEYVEPPIISNSFRAALVGKKKKRQKKNNKGEEEEEEEQEEEDDGENGKGNKPPPSEIAPSRAAKKREKKAKKKRNGRGVNTDEDEDEDHEKKRVPNGGIQGKKKKKKKKKKESDSDASSSSSYEEKTETKEEKTETSVEHNRFEILSDNGKDDEDDKDDKEGKEDKEEKKAKKKKVPNDSGNEDKEEKKSKKKKVLNDNGNEDKEEKKAKKKKNDNDNGNGDCEKNKKVEKKGKEERKAEDKLVVGEIMTNNDTEAVATVAVAAAVESKRTVKLIFGDDIRFAQVPTNCTVLKLREIICNRFPNCKSILIKYKDQEGDMVTMTTSEEFKWAQSSVSHGFIRLHIVDVNPDQDPLLLENIDQEEEEKEEEEGEVEEYENQTKLAAETTENTARRSRPEGSPSCIIDDWTIHFAYLFKHYVGFESDYYLDLHDVGVKLYSEAMEETVTSEEAQDILTTSEEKFQELAALALFNWGNVLMSRARRRAFTEEYDVGDSEPSSIMSHITDAFTLVQKEYTMAGKRFEEALKIKPNFYEAIIALGQLQFEQAKLSWHYALSTETDLESWPSSEVLQLYSNASKNMERGIKMWEEALVQHLIEVANNNQSQGSHAVLQQMKLGNLFSEISAEETAEQAANIRSQVNLLWGTMLYERSVVEFKLGVPNWEHCLGAASDKFQLAGASPDDIAVMVKNHCSNSIEGYNVDETEQAWNEMYEAIRWQMEIPGFHLEPLLRQRVSSLDNNA